ncbi:hypothetical protein [Mycolicibacterium fluoranthenivorans]|uniref:Helix-turn-helix DNA binding domain protein n=1 Tax=Mycolicibacterium fluoranthenivorans TaxID=258505 RepID=A0A7X5ZFB2_9MYCO|nr:hypothetical protein [Mycolicibacterium fluoranthenivorans]MCV7358507.1 hypothetical protein [Mycolicibacterium fluoranthenivorans]NIH98084.1 hypothetical protein [Mycolicibacterium fluoranthenivorans]
MPWFNVDDGFANSKPVMRIPRRYRTTAIGLWTLTGSWSAKELTDGHIPAEVVEEFGGTPKIVDLLVDSGLWERVEDGVQFSNWAKWQKTKQQVVDFRAAEAERKRKQRERISRPSKQGEREMSRNGHETVPTSVPVGHQRESALPTPEPLPTPSPSPNPVVTYGGEVTSADAGVNTPPPEFCPQHPEGTDAPCRACGGARQRRQAWEAEHGSAVEASAAAAKAERKRVLADCPDCDEYGWTTDETGQTTPDSVKCTHGAAVVSHA